MFDSNLNRRYWSELADGQLCAPKSHAPTVRSNICALYDINQPPNPETLFAQTLSETGWFSLSKNLSSQSTRDCQTPSFTHPTQNAAWVRQPASQHILRVVYAASGNRWCISCYAQHQPGCIPYARTTSLRGPLLQTRWFGKYISTCLMGSRSGSPGGPPFESIKGHPCMCVISNRRIPGSVVCARYVTNRRGCFVQSHTATAVHHALLSVGHVSSRTPSRIALACPAGIRRSQLRAVMRWGTIFT